MSRWWGKAKRVRHEQAEERYRYLNLVRADLKTRIEMWQRTGNSRWINDDTAHQKSLELLMAAISEPPDIAAAQETLGFLASRLAALDRTQRDKEAAELDALLRFLRERGLRITSPSPGPAPKRRRNARPLPDLAALMRFYNEAERTPTTRAFGEFILSRLDEYDETFLSGLDALAVNQRLLGETGLAKGVEDLKNYILRTKAMAKEHGVQALLDDLAWGDAMTRAQALAAGHEDRALMEAALAQLRAVIERTSRAKGRRLSRVGELATVLLQRFQRSGLPGDLDECILVQREAVTLAPKRSAELAAMDANLGLLLEIRFEQRMRAGAENDARADLDEAIEVTRASVRLTPAEDPMRANRVGALATMLLNRPHGPLPDDEVIALLEEAVSAGDADSGRQASLRQLLDLARAKKESRREDPRADDPRRALRSRLERLEQGGAATGEQLLAGDDALGEPWPPKQLDEGITRLRDALKSASRHAPHISRLHAELGIALWERFRHERSPVDITEAIDHLTKALELADDLTPDLLVNLGTAFLTLGEQTHDLPTLDKAIEAFREALKSLPSGVYGRSMCLSNLGMALQFRYSVANRPTDATEAVAVLRETVRDTPLLDPARPGRLTNLCMALRSGFELTHDRSQLDEAINAGKAALTNLPLDSIHRARLLANVGTCFESQYKETASSQALSQAMDYLEQAARSEMSPVWDRIRPARGWGLLAADAGQYTVAATAFGYAVALLPVLAWHGMEPAERLSYLGGAGLSDLACEAASCAIADGRPDQAIRLLEQGRGVLLSQILDLRTDLSSLAGDHPGLAAELKAVRAGLDGREEPGRESRRELAQRWDRLVQEVRSLPGYAGFLLPPRLETLLPAAAAGPVVVVNVSSRRCDALLVTEHGVELVELPGLTSDAVTNQADRYLSVLQNAERTTAEAVAAQEKALRSGTAAASQRYVKTQRARQDAHREMEQTLQEIVVWLWDSVAEPVLTTLGFTEPSEHRVWWCPTGALSLLPLHAATRRDGGRHSGSVLDRVVSSYTPTLAALAEARKDRAYGEAQDRMLVVALPKTPGQPPLRQAAVECDLLKARFPDRHTLLLGRAATKGRVSRELPGHRWAHFSCHGDQDLAQPLQGGLLLHDGMLTFADIAAQGHHGEFAFLSACKTATSSPDFANEAITTAAALHCTGYRHVIATSWSVLASVASDLCETVYDELVSDGAFVPDHAATALHHAVRQLRDAHVEQPSVWIPFVHIGP